MGLASTLGVTIQQPEMIQWATLKQHYEKNRLEYNMLEKYINKFKKDYQASINELQGKYVTLIEGNALASYGAGREELGKI